MVIVSEWIKIWSKMHLLTSREFCDFFVKQKWIKSYTQQQVCVCDLVLYTYYIYYKMLNYQMHDLWFKSDFLDFPFKIY